MFWEGIGNGDENLKLVGIKVRCNYGNIDL